MNSTTPPSAPASNGWRTHSFVDQPTLLNRAADLFCAARGARAALPLSADEARCVLSHMRLVSCPKGTVLFREGDDRRADHMLLLLEGEVSVDTGQTGPHQAVAISVLGPGSAIGEMSMLDGGPRSASCTAVSAVMAAGMSRLGLERLVDEHPRAAAKLLALLSHFTAERLRAMSQQLQIYAQLNDALHQELQRARQPATRRTI